MNFESKKDKKEIDIDADCPVCSSGDLTGLIPAGIQNDAQLESYEDMYSFVPKPITEKKENHTEN